MLIVSCVGKEANVALHKLRFSGKRIDLSNLLEILSFDHRPYSKEIVGFETRTLTLSVFSGRSVQASILKKGGSGNREILAVELEEL